MIFFFLVQDSETLGERVKNLKNDLIDHIVVVDVIFIESDTIVGLWLAMKRWARGGVESGGGGEWSWIWQPPPPFLNKKA